MNDQNEIKENQGDPFRTQTGSNPVEKSILVVAFYIAINIFYVLLFLASLPIVYLSTFIFDGGYDINAQIAFILTNGIPIIIIAILWIANYFYKKGQIKATFLVLLLPPPLYLVLAFINDYLWSL